MADFYAHIRDDKEFDFIQHQTLEDHVKHAASYAADYLSGMGLRDVGFLAGICHDAGKYKMEYQNYLLSEEKSVVLLITRLRDVVYCWKNFMAIE